MEFNGKREKYCRVVECEKDSYFALSKAEGVNDTCVLDRKLKQSFVPNKPFDAKVDHVGALGNNLAVNNDGNVHRAPLKAKNNSFDLSNVVEEEHNVLDLENGGSLFGFKHHFSDGLQASSSKDNELFGCCYYYGEGGFD